MTTPESKTSNIIEKIFRNFTLQYGLSEFVDYNIEQILSIQEKEKGRFYLKDIKTGTDRFVYDSEKQNSRPEEIVRQLWLYKLNKCYKFPFDRIETEKSIHFGREVHKKSADIVVYKEDKITPYIIIEVKSPSEDKGIDQLKSYLNAEGCEIGVWSNGNDRIILYRNYPNNFEDTLPDIPSSDSTIDDLLEEKKSLYDYTDPDVNLKRIIEIMEELVLANSGVDVFNESFKLIYAKLFDEIEAEKRENNEIYFRKYKDPKKTYSVINSLFRNAIQKWPGIFFDQEVIRLSAEHLSIVVGELEKARLMGADLRIVDEAFEYLIPEVAKGKKGQYFTPRHVIDMAVNILNPQPNEYVLDPAAGSGGFLIGAMNYVNDNYLNSDAAKKEYAQEHLYGIDFADETAKVSRALMLIAGDGRSHLFKLNSLDPREWQGDDEEKEHARSELRRRLYKSGDFETDQENNKIFKNFSFDLILTNPPFAGEIKDQGVLRQFNLAKKNGKLIKNIERHILFIERIIELLRPGGRTAVVLPQGVFNNSNMQFVREFLADKAKILAVIGLHVNTFKPHTGTKTSVLFLQKWGGEAGEPISDYTVFMAVSQKSGKNNSGEYDFKKDSEGAFLHDGKGRRILDSDLEEITMAYKDSCKVIESNFSSGK